MIFHRQDSRRNLRDFGIAVPLLDDRVEQVLNHLCAAKKQLVKEDHAKNITHDDLLRVHHQSFITEITSNNPNRAVMQCYELVDQQGQFHRYNPSEQKLPFSALVKCALAHIEGSYTAARYALEHKRSFFLGGGLHHAFPDEGRGFCLLHDVAVVIRKLQFEKRIQRAWIIDIDAHKGDGSAVIFKSDPSVKTFSIHMQESWPLDMGDGPWHTASTVDVGMNPQESGEQYLAKLTAGLEQLSLVDSWPDLCFVIAGSDPYEHDTLPSTASLKLNLQQMYARDELVWNFLKQQHIPQVYVMAGGYGPRVFEVYSQFLNQVFQ